MILANIPEPCLLKNLGGNRKPLVAKRCDSAGKGKEINLLRVGMHKCPRPSSSEKHASLNELIRGLPNSGAPDAIGCRQYGFRWNSRPDRIFT